LKLVLKIALTKGNANFTVIYRGKNAKTYILFTRKKEKAECYPSFNNQTKNKYNLHVLSMKKLSQNKNI
jgi:hypothetical protein